MNIFLVFFAFTFGALLFHTEAAGRSSMHKPFLQLARADMLLAATYCIPFSRSAVIPACKLDVVFRVILRTPFFRLSITSHEIVMYKSIKTERS
jgi:hypothetical protein